MIILRSISHGTLCYLLIREWGEEGKRQKKKKKLTLFPRFEIHSFEWEKEWLLALR